MDTSGDSAAPSAKEGSGSKKKNLSFFRPRLYILERRRTDTIIAESSAAAEEEKSSNLRRSQSDRTEYSRKLKEKMTPHAIPETVTSALDLEEQRQRKMARRSKIIKELVQTERDYLSDLELCISEVVQPLRKKQVESLDVDGLFSNIESVCQISATLLSLLEEATADDEPEMQVIGEVFLQIKTPLEEVYKIYCYHHNDANTLLEMYEKEEDLQQHLRNQVNELKRSSTLLDMGSILIKPVQRVMKYPLLLSELLNSTPDLHADYKPVKEALAAVKEINMNINELKRRKDLVMKYKNCDEDESLRHRLSKLNIRSIVKKSNRVTSHLKILTGGEHQVKDEIFDREEKMFRNLEKAVRLCAKNTSCYLQNIQEGILLAVQNVHDLQKILRDSNHVNGTYLQELKNSQSSFEHFKDNLERQVVMPLAALQTLFSGPQKLIQKRYDKMLDYISRLERSESVKERKAAEELNLAKKDYEALNAQLVEELQKFNKAARTVLNNCIYCFTAAFRDHMTSALLASPAVKHLPASLSMSIGNRQSQVFEEIHHLWFVKEFSTGTQRLVERRLSSDERLKKRLSTSIPDAPHQTEDHRSKLLSEHSPEKLFQAKRKFNAAQEQDVCLYEGEIVAILEQQDPMGSTSRWLVDTGMTQGYVYSSFLRPYNLACGQNVTSAVRYTPNGDFDDFNLFVSPHSGDTNSVKSLLFRGSNGNSSVNGCQEGIPPIPEPVPKERSDDSSSDLGEHEIFYAVYSFQARNEHELSLQEQERVRILKFSDLSGNKDWWLAEAKGQKGYVPANHLGRMSYA
uniref:Dynamin-binding protein n=2 Tax=Callorhinchus milii TaxID=7868 RepID=A0A4W3JA02_CALMI|eukprot:gi/632949424/ref/XP_007890149.1/ PREDICTED: rho guanine nucleotide exchange factor 38 isoform X2 [Callorhinchus milii]